MAAVLTRLVSTPGRLMGRSTANEKVEPSSEVSDAGTRLSDEEDEDAEGELDDEVDDTQVNGDVDEGRVHSQGDTDESENDEEEEEEYDEERFSIEPETQQSRLDGGNSRRRRGWNRTRASSNSASTTSDTDNRSTVSSRSSSRADEWEAESDAEEQEIEIGNVSPNRCLFCGEDEEHDPSEEFEEYLACVDCGTNAHRHCAREADALGELNVSEGWQCPTCSEHSLMDHDENGALAHELTRESAPRLARDLLPPQRNVRKGSHSVFNTLILVDDPLDGSRSLRKRKVSNEDHAEFRKRRKRSASDRDPKNSIAIRSVSPDARINGEDGAFHGVELTSAKVKGRGRSQRLSERKFFRTVRHDENHFIIGIRCDAKRLDRILDERRKKRGREREAQRRADKAQMRELPLEEISHYPALQASSFATQFFMHEREGDESKPKPYGGILTESEADTHRTFPQVADRKKFEDARLKAEENWKKKIAAAAAAAAENARPGQKPSGPPSKIKCISFGGFEIDTWHAAPYPEEYSRNRVLHICEFCLKYMNSDFVAWRHKLKCPDRHPPGDEIYRDGSFSFFEVDGRKNPVYCQNLCLLAKLFLGSKTLYYDVEPFLFYVMTENDEYGCHFVGYFSKEKRPSSLNNVSCILVLPIHQRRGFGHYLIDFSYLLTRVEKKTGSPEKPLSDMGLVSYRSYWRLVMCYQLLEQKGQVSITTISEKTGMTADDIVSALEGLRALVRDPLTKTYALRLDYPFFRQYIENYEKKGYAKVNTDALVWVPYVMGRDNMHYENAAPLHTVAQRDEDLDMGVSEDGVPLALSTTASHISIEGGNEGDAPMQSDGGHVDEVDPSTQFPNFAPVDPTLVDSESPVAKVNHPRITPTTPFVKPSERTSPIPATRFEVYPPLPGTALRRRPGRPYGRGNRRGTPIRRNNSSGFNDLGEATSRTSTVRKNRSRLHEVVPDDDEEEELDDDTTTAIKQDHDDEKEPNGLTTTLTLDGAVDANGIAYESDDDDDEEGDQDGDAVMGELDDDDAYVDAEERVDGE